MGRKAQDGLFNVSWRAKNKPLVLYEAAVLLSEAAVLLVEAHCPLLS